MSMLPPLRFTPIFRDYLWGGRRLASWLPEAPGQGPIAEVWLLSDEAENPSRVAQGPLAGLTIRELADRFGPRLLGPGAARRFPVLLKLLDAALPLSVQVHPNDQQAQAVSPELRGKTEAWVVLDAQPGSVIYAGLTPGTTPDQLRQTPGDVLHSFEPKSEDVVFLRAGTVHALGAGVTIFEIQQTSDITYRLYDWDRVDAKTNKMRPLHVEEGIACTDFTRGPVSPTTLPIQCEYFSLHRHDLKSAATIGRDGEPRVLVVIDGVGSLQTAGGQVDCSRGQAWLIPAESGRVSVAPNATAVILECTWPTDA